MIPAHSMPARHLLSMVVCAVVFGVLGYRSMMLKRRVETLGRELGSGPSDAGTSEALSNGTSVLAASTHRERLAKLEQGVSEVRSRLKAIDYAVRGAPTLPDPQHGKEILSVIQREKSRVLDVQLAWSRTHWQEAREEQLKRLGQDMGLSGQQVGQLRTTLTRELDAMVEVLRRPDLFEDPERTARDWQAILRSTDQTATDVLTPAQLQIWKQARAAERKLLWPWLPEEK